MYARGVKHLVILPKGNRVSKLVIEQIHKDLGQMEETLSCHSYVKYIGSSAVRKMTSDCLICRRLKATHGKQKMADVPRLTPD